MTAEELNTAKKSYVETFPRTFATKAQVAVTFAQDEMTGRYASDPEYWKNYRAKVEKVAAADVQRVARKFLASDKLVILVVGKKSDILAGDLKHEVSLQALAGRPPRRRAAARPDDHEVGNQVSTCHKWRLSLAPSEG